MSDHFSVGNPMGFIFFGVAFGLFIGTGLFMLVIFPALRERRQEASEASKDREQEHSEPRLKDKHE